MASVDLNWGHITLMNDAKKSGCGVNPYSIFRWDVHGSDRNWLGSWWISPIYGNFMGGKQSTESTSIGVYHNPWTLSSSRTKVYIFFRKLLKASLTEFLTKLPLYVKPSAVVYLRCAKGVQTKMSQSEN